MTGPTTHSLVKVLRTIHTFAGLDDGELLEIVGASSNLAYAADETIFESGSQSEALYVILSGRVRIENVSKGGGIADLQRGDSFGEISLLRRTSHTKTARAIEPTELLAIPSDAFEELLKANGELRAHVEKHMARREVVGEDA